MNLSRKGMKDLLKCPICGVQVYSLTANHIESHNYTVHDWFTKYPETKKYWLGKVCKICKMPNTNISNLSKNICDICKRKGDRYK